LRELTGLLETYTPETPDVVAALASGCTDPEVADLVSRLLRAASRRTSAYEQLNGLRQLVRYAPPTDRAANLAEIIDLAPILDPIARSDLYADVAQTLTGLPRPAAAALLDCVLHAPVQHTRGDLLTPTSTSWADPIEAQFGPLRMFTMANSDYPNHVVLARDMQAYTCAGATPTPGTPT
jgi:hypothetical protein